MGRVRPANILPSDENKARVCQRRVQVGAICKEPRLDLSESQNAPLTPAEHSLRYYAQDGCFGQGIRAPLGFEHRM